MDNYNYPIGADNDDAPWKQKDIPEKEIEVLVSVVLSKTVKIKVDDYEVTESGVDEDGIPYEYIDYSNCDLKKAVEDQITLPQNIGDFINDLNQDVIKFKKEYNPNDLLGWNVDDFEVIFEDY